MYSFRASVGLGDAVNIPPYFSEFENLLFAASTLRQLNSTSVTSAGGLLCERFRDAEPTI